MEVGVGVGIGIGACATMERGYVEFVYCTGSSDDL